MNDCMKWLSSMVQITDGMKNYLLGLIFVSVVTTLLILLLKAMAPFFKSRYSIGLKQILWIMLALRLIIPISYGDTFFKITATEYENGAKEYATDKITDETNKIAYVTLPKQISDKEASEKESYTQILSGANTGKDDVSFSDRLVSIESEAATNRPLVQKKMNLWAKIKLGVLQFVSYVNAHIASIGIVYAAGVGLFLLYHLLAMLFYKNRRRKKRHLVENQEYLQLLHKTAARIGVKRIPILYEMEGLASPMATGFFRFQIYILKKDYSSKELGAIFAHELTHIHHQDLRIKILYLLANALHWFNPFVYLMLKTAGQDMELYCDKSVVELYDWQGRQEYNELLLDILQHHTKEQKQEYLTTCFQGGVQEMKERFLGNLDMRKKREGVVPTLLIAAIIAVSAGVFSIETHAVLKGESAEHSIMDSWVWDLASAEYVSGDEETEVADNIEDLEETYINENGVRQPIYYTSAHYDAGEQQYEKVVDHGNGIYGIPIHYNDDLGGIDMQEIPIKSDRERMEAIPNIQIYCGKTKIEDYGITHVVNWGKGVEYQNTSNFFAEQCQKGEENPLFYVETWEDFYIDAIRLFFPDGQVPDAVEVEDRVYNEDGNPRYQGEAFENIFRAANITSEMSVVDFALAEHYSIKAYEVRNNLQKTSTLYKREMAIHPYYRGYSVKCYWANKDDYQSCTYEFVLRTQTTVEVE